MSDPIDELSARWKDNPEPAVTIALCDALRGSVRSTLVQQVGEVATKKYGSNVPVLLAVGRMYMNAQRFGDAQKILVAAGKIAPHDPGVYRALGEALLRRGDAERAEKVLGRAIQLGGEDEETSLWLDRARLYRPVQARAGARAVAAEVANNAPLDMPRAPFDSTTEVRAVPREVLQDAREPEVLSAIPALDPEQAHYPKHIETMPAFVPPQDGMQQVAAAPPMVEAHTADLRTATGPGVMPHPRDVLDALALAGVFEPPNGVGASIWARPERTSRGRSVITLAVVTILAVVGGGVLYRQVETKRSEEHSRAETLLQSIETDMRASHAGALANLEQSFRQVFDMDSRSTRAALDWGRERALFGLLRGGGEVAFEDAIARAKEVSVPDASIAFAHLASFLFQGDTAGAAALLSRWDGPAASDPWYQLLSGATLERAGDARATDRYASATTLDPAFFYARVSFVRQMAIDGNPQKATELAKQLRAQYPDRVEGAALIALAWARDPGRDDQPPPETEEAISRLAELPVGLLPIPHALLALRAIDKNALADAKTEIQKALTNADSPGMASWLGTIALETGDEQLARKAALSAVSFSAVYPPARVLAARVALLGGRLDEASKATEELEASSPDVAIVRAAIAYERFDADALSRALESVSAETRKFPFFVSLAEAPNILVGHVHMRQAKLVTMADDDAPWSDLLAMDMALDEGDIETAKAVSSHWKGSEDSPLRAIRLARLARYEEKLDKADALSRAAMGSGLPTVRALIERIFLLVAEAKPQDANALLAKYSSLLGPLASWLGGYINACSGKAEEARAKTATLEVLPSLAPLPARVLVAASLGSMKDKHRGVDVVRELMASGAANYDVLKAASALGLAYRAPVHRK